MNKLFRSKLFRLSAIFFLMPVAWAQAQTIGRPAFVFNNFHVNSPTVHIMQPAIRTNVPAVMQVPRLNTAQTTSINNAAASRFLYHPYANNSTLNLAAPVIPAKPQVTRPYYPPPLGTTIGAKDLSLANDYSAQQVRQVQQALHRLGYYNGSIDGSFGPATENAVESYQTSTGEPVTGTLTLGVLSRLGVQLGR